MLADQAQGVVAEKAREEEGMRRTRDATVQTIAGQRQRCCGTCREWLPEDDHWFRWRADKGAWNSECRCCENARRRAYYQERLAAA